MFHSAGDSITQGTAALAAAVKALPVDRAKARKVFVIATKDDPDMADGWLGRVAAEDRSLATLQRAGRTVGGDRFGTATAGRGAA